jgi:hypothetical protein
MKKIATNLRIKFRSLVSLFFALAIFSSSQRSTIPPSEEFIAELKKKNGCSDGKSDHLTHCYYLGNVDFGEYEPINYQNAFTSYRKLFDLGKHDEMKFKRNIYESETRYREEKFGKHYQQYHKGYPVITKNFECTLELDSSQNRIIRGRAFIVKDLDVDTAIVISEERAFDIAKNAIPIERGENFIYEQSVTQNAEIKIPNVNLKIYQDRLTYSYIFITRENTNPYHIYEAFIDVKTGELVHLK